MKNMTKKVIGTSTDNMTKKVIGTSTKNTTKKVITNSENPDTVQRIVECIASELPSNALGSSEQRLHLVLLAGFFAVNAVEPDLTCPVADALEREGIEVGGFSDRLTDYLDRMGGVTRREELDQRLYELFPAASRRARPVDVFLTVFGSVLGAIYGAVEYAKPVIAEASRADRSDHRTAERTPCRPRTQR